MHCVMTTTTMTNIERLGFVICELDYQQATIFNAPRNQSNRKMRANSLIYRNPDKREGSSYSHTPNSMHSFVDLKCKLCWLLTQFQRKRWLWTVKAALSMQFKGNRRSFGIFTFILIKTANSNDLFNGNIFFFRWLRSSMRNAG